MLIVASLRRVLRVHDTRSVGIALVAVYDVLRSVALCGCVRCHIPLSHPEAVATIAPACTNVLVRVLSCVSSSMKVKPGFGFG